MDGHEHEETKDLYTLVGRYEEYTKATNIKLDQIMGRLEDGDRKFDETHDRVMDNENQIKDHEKRVKALERNGMPKKAKLQLDGTTLLTIINAVITALERILR
jgi:hypothetical protein